MTHIETMG